MYKAILSRFIKDTMDQSYNRDKKHRISLKISVGQHPIKRSLSCYKRWEESMKIVFIQVCCKVLLGGCKWFTIGISAVKISSYAATDLLKL
jgi:hypothetical protein